MYYKYEFIGGNIINICLWSTNTPKISLAMEIC